MERKMEYIGFREKSCDIVTIGCDWFDYRKDEKELPKVGAWCKTCARETAKPVYPIYMNCKPAYALRCEKCGGEYPMYQSMFIQRYVGYDMHGGGHVNPTHGVISHRAAMDRRARENIASIPKKVENDMCELFHCSHEEYQEMRRQWDEDKRKAHKRFENERANSRAQYREDQIKRESESRKELIEKGILKYIKNIGLVNTETGQVVKL